MFRIVAVIVTYNRKELLQRCLDATVRQTQKPDLIVVVDNASTDGTINMLSDTGWLNRDDFELLKLPTNVGGAGGFVAGIECALGHGAEWVWLMDDDGYPKRSCLETQYECVSRNQLEAVSPIQIDIRHRDKLAFRFMNNESLRVGYSEFFGDTEFVEGDANLFNGALMSSSVFSKIGVPRAELFIRGDEVEFTQRMKRGSVRFGTLVAAHFYHPSDAHERIPVFFGLTIIRDAGNDFKNYYLFRNRALSFKENGLLWLVPLDFIRYVYYFLIVRKGKLRQFRLWLTATKDGLSGQLGRHADY